MLIDLHLHNVTSSDQLCFLLLQTVKMGDC